MGIMEEDMKDEPYNVSIQFSELSSAGSPFVRLSSNKVPPFSVQDFPIISVRRYGILGIGWQCKTAGATNHLEALSATPKFHPVRGYSHQGAYRD